MEEENSVKNVGTVRNWPPSPAEAAPSLCYISLIHEPAIMGNERGEGRGGQGVAGGQGNQRIVRNEC